jgi:hypothetical protein
MGEIVPPFDALSDIRIAEACSEVVLGEYQVYGLDIEGSVDFPPEPVDIGMIGLVYLSDKAVAQHIVIGAEARQGSDQLATFAERYSSGYRETIGPQNEFATSIGTDTQLLFASLKHTYASRLCCHAGPGKRPII